MKIVFMGTPEFAVPSLRRLVESGYDIVGVFTQPDKLGNRRKLTMPPVKEYAMSAAIPVFQPETMRSADALDTVRKLEADLTVVAAYGQILPQAVLDAPKLGSINVHASILPKYRGAAPINRAILDGESETGVTIMRMARQLDAGDIISIRKTPILPEYTAQTLFALLADLGAKLLCETIPAIADGTAVYTPQNEAEATFAPKLSRELSPVDWNRPARAVFDQIRALTPWPVATATIDGQNTKLWRAELGGPSSDPAGTLRAQKNGVEAVCGDGNTLIITELQREGGSRMSGSAWFNGKRLPAGTVLA